LPRQSVSPAISRSICSDGSIDLHASKFRQAVFSKPVAQANGPSTSKAPKTA
jgi:hypothetical protein